MFRSNHSPRRSRAMSTIATLAMAVFFALASCGSATATDPTQSTGQRFPTPVPGDIAAEAALPTVDASGATSDEGTESSEPAADDGAEDDSGALDPADVVANRLTVNVLSERPHDPDSFTQGLLIDEEGRMFESTGHYGPSITRLIELDKDTGETLRYIDVSLDVWGEGLALVGDRFVQLTYTSKIAYVWDKETFEKIGEFRYDTAGWGLCYDEATDRLVMSDGSAILTFRDPRTFAPLGSVTVMLDGVPLAAVNELECVGGTVWANVFTTDLIVEIEPDNGAVITVVSATELNQPRPFDSNAVLNGIAYDPETGHFLLTGKLWDVMYEVEFVSP